MRPRSRSRPLRPPQLLLSQGLFQPVGSLRRKTLRPLPIPKEPLNRIAGGLAYLAEGVYSGVSSATATSPGLSRREPSVVCFGPREHMSIVRKSCVPRCAVTWPNAVGHGADTVPALSMSAFGGKADIAESARRCPLTTQNGHFLRIK